MKLYPDQCHSELCLQKAISGPVRRQWDRGEGNFVGQNHWRAFDRKWPVPVPQSHAKNLPHDSVKGAERLRHPHDRVVGTLSYRRPQRQFRERVLCQMPTACHSRSLGQQDKWFLSPAWVANRLS